MTFEVSLFIMFYLYFYFGFGAFISELIPKFASWIDIQCSVNKEEA